MKLTAEIVHDTFMKCLFEEGENTENHKLAEGLKLKVGFHPERLKEAEPIITELLDELPDNFKIKNGGGWSFINMCQDKHGNQWCDLHETMDKLVVLGIAIEKLSYLMPRDVWSALPGGVPYIVIN